MIAPHATPYRDHAAAAATMVSAFMVRLLVDEHLTIDHVIALACAWMGAGMPTPESVPICNACGLPSPMGMAVLWQDTQRLLLCASCQGGFIREGWVRMGEG